MLGTVKQFAHMVIRKSFRYAKDTELARRKAAQWDEFSRLNTQFDGILSNFSRADSDRYILGTWKRFNERFREMCRNGVPPDFLQHSIVLDTLTANPLKPIWKPFVEDVIRDAPPSLLAAMEEDLVGMPRICWGDPLTSPGRIVHGWTLLQFLKAVGAVEIGGELRIRDVVEYGGGYGGLVTVWKRLNSALTYTIIDTPIMLSIQWLYLSSVMGQETVHCLTEGNQKPLPGKINLMPVAFLDRGDLKPDVFVSTWALSESPTLTQQLVINRNWYGAPHLLLAFQRASKSFPFAEELAIAGSQRGGKVRDLPYMFEGNSFALFV